MAVKARAVIGVSSYLEHASMGVWNTRSIFLPLSYVTPISKAGATIVVLPPQELSPGAVERVLDGVDGLCLAGGYDVDPSLYGAEAHPQTDEPREVRDAWELALLTEASKRDMPILGVCRGAQVLNVLRGGTLHQHVPDVVGSTVHQGASGVFSTVAVELEPGSALASVHPTSATVPVYHHQAIDELGDGLVVTARSSLGIVEAIEDPSLSFCIATQWHPEQDQQSGELYSAFVAAASRYRDLNH